MKYQSTYQAGQSLVEMVVVIGVVVLLAVGIIAGTTASLSATQNAQTRSNALKFASEGIERTRELRDAGWNEFAALGEFESTYCVGDDGEFTLAATSCTSPNIEDRYIRAITLALVPAGDEYPAEKMSVRVAVSWEGTTQLGNSVELVTYLTQWR